MFSSFASSLSAGSSYKIDAAYNCGNIIIPNYLGFWQVHEGTSKKTGLKVSIFKFDKKTFEGYVGDKRIIKETYNKIELDMANIQKIKHPNFLNVIEPLEVHSRSFIFVTEFISGNLRMTYGNDNMFTLGNKGGNDKDTLLFKKGLYELSKALDFAHNKINKVVLNLNPDVIFIDGKGSWKIGSLVKLQPKADTYFDLNYSNEYEYGTNVNYFAPELVLDGKLNYTSDYFSLGLIVYFLFYGSDILKIENQSLEIYKLEYRKLESKILKIGYKNLFPLLIINNHDYFFIRFLNAVMNRDYGMRCMSLLDWINDEFNSDDDSKDNELIKTLLFIEKGEFYSVDSKSQIVFLNGLAKIWHEFNRQIVLNQVVALLMEIVTLHLGEKQKKHDETDLSFLKISITLLLDISNDVLTVDEFTNNVFEKLVFEKLIIINQIFEIFLMRIDIFKTKLQPESFLFLLNDVFLKRIIKKDLVSTPENLILQQAILSKQFIATLGSCNNFEFTKNYTNPVLLKIFSSTQSLKIKLNCLDVIEELVLMEKINKYQISESILGILENNKTNHIKIAVAILNLLKKLIQSKDFYNDDKEILLNRILSLLWKLSMTPGLDLDTFSSFQSIINYTTRRIQELQIVLIKSQSGSSSANGNKVGEHSFHDIVQNVDIEQGTDSFNNLEEKQLQTLNLKAGIMKPTMTHNVNPIKQNKSFDVSSEKVTLKLADNVSADLLKQKGPQFISTELLQPKTSQNISSSVLQPKNRSNYVSSSVEMTVLQPKVKR